MVNPCHLSKFIECITPRISPNVNHGFWVTMMYQCKLLDCDKCLVSIDSSGGCMQVGQGVYREISVHPFPIVL